MNLTFHFIRICEISRVRIFKLLVIRDNLCQLLLIQTTGKFKNINNKAITVLQTVVCIKVLVGNTFQVSAGAGSCLNYHFIF